MFYVELLRARNAFLISTGILAALALLGTILASIYPGMHFSAKDGWMALIVVGYAAAIGAGILATLFGGSLAAENDHLEMTWTRPISRTAYSSGVFAIDIACILAVFAVALGCGYLFASYLAGGLVHVTLDSALAARLARFAIFPLAYFGFVQAATASMKSCNWGTVGGLSWPVNEALAFFGARMLAQPWHGVLSVINIANPIAYFPIWEFDEAASSHTMRVSFGYGLTADILALAAITLAGVIIATLRWRRLEA